MDFLKSKLNKEKLLETAANMKKNYDEIYSPRLKKTIADVVNNWSPNNRSKPIAGSSTISVSPSDGNMPISVHVILKNTQVRQNEELMEEELSEFEKKQLRIKNMSLVNIVHPLVELDPDAKLFNNIMSYLNAYQVHTSIANVCRKWRQNCLLRLEHFVFNEKCCNEPFITNENSSIELTMDHNHNNNNNNNNSNTIGIALDNNNLESNEAVNTIKLKNFLYRILLKAHMLKHFIVLNTSDSSIVQQLANDDMLRQMLVDSENCFRRKMQLEYLDLSECDYITDYGFELLVTHPDIVKHLTTFVFSKSNGAMHDLILEKYICHLVNLKSLVLSRCSFISAYGLKKCSLYLKQLHTLNISGCNNIKEFTWLKNLENLQHLIIRHCTSLDDESFLAFIPSVPNLKELDVSGCKITGTLCLLYMLTFLKNIEILNLSGTNIANCQYESIDVEKLPSEVQQVFNFILNILNRDLWDAMFILSHFSTLHTLDISHLNIVIDNHSSWKKLSNLIHLNMSLCSQLNNDDFVQLIPHLTNLESINLSWCNIEDSGLILLAHTCGKNLKELILKNCKHITSESIRVVLEKCPNLHTLNLVSTKTIAQYEIKKLIGMKHLTKLNIVNALVEEISPEEISELKHAISRNKH
jgi:hypothetical protein